jgi:lipoyl(octanoyl) transferase
MPPQWLIVQYDQIDYVEALNLQRALVDAVNSGGAADGVVLFLEHPRVFTLGRRGGMDHLGVSRSFLKKEAIPIIHVERGGDITYHGPGQLVGYPVVRLRSTGLSVVSYVMGLESLMIRTAADFGVHAQRDDRNRGIWVGNNKLGSIGIHVRHGVSFHGFALNVSVDLTPFSWIDPCGLCDVGVTSLEAESGDKDPISMDAVRRAAVGHLAEIFGVTLVDTTPAELSLLLKAYDEDYENVSA